MRHWWNTSMVTLTAFSKQRANVSHKDLPRVYCATEDEIMGYFALNASRFVRSKDNVSSSSFLLRGNAMRVQTIRAFARRVGQKSPFPNDRLLAVDG